MSTESQGVGVDTANRGAVSTCDNEKESSLRIGNSMLVQRLESMRGYILSFHSILQHDPRMS